MIHIESLPLLDNAQIQLDEYQSQVDAKPTYKEQLEKAKSSFSSKNRKSNKTFKAVKKALDRMCSGARRCHYGEDSAADEVEHFYPDKTKGDGFCHGGFAGTIIPDNHMPTGIITRTENQIEVLYGSYIFDSC